MSKILQKNAWQADYLHQCQRQLVEQYKSEQFIQGQQQHLQQFLALDWPGRQHEAWRYLRLQPIVDQEFGLLNNVSVEMARPQPAVDVYEFVFINGVLQTQWLDLSALPAGLVLSPLQLLSEQGCLDDGVKLSGASQEKIVQLNQALAATGMQLLIKPGVQIDKPLCLQHYFIGQQAPSMLHTQHQLTIAEGARAQVIETFRCEGHHELFTTDLTAVKLHAGAELHYVKLQAMNASSSHLARTLIYQAADSVLYGFSMNTNGALNRDHVTINLAGESAHSNWSGLLMAKQKHCLALYLDVRHLAPHTQSQQTLKSIADDTSQVVVNGNIYVDPAAIYSQAHLQNKNLLLSDSAQINTKPQLEIHTDQVQCSHGATVGQLDLNALFYLQSRGLDYDAASQILRQAFLRDVIDGYDSAVLQQFLRSELRLRELDDE